MNSLPNLKLGNIKDNHPSHSEVLGLLGPAWKENNLKVLKIIQNLINKRPNKTCYIASQQLGESTHLSGIDSSFLHRDAIWKPWISGAWKAGDRIERVKSLKWMEECWSNLEFICPGVHLAQIHPHLPWHQKELLLAFKDWLPKLKELKSIYDPRGVMPPLS